MKTWVVTWVTESGDRGVFAIQSERKPPKDQIDAILYRMMPTEYEEVGFVDWEIEEQFIAHLPSQEEIDNMKNNTITY